MNINASIVDQRLSGMIERCSAQLEPYDDTTKRSRAFVAMCMACDMDIREDEALDLLTDGGNDAGIDGLYVSEPEDDEFVVTLFQGKYKKSLDGESNFPESAVEKAISIVRLIFDPAIEITVNKVLTAKIEEIRSLINEGYIPKIRFILCNNGKKWLPKAQEHIDAAVAQFGDKLDFYHFNHDSIINILQKSPVINDRIQFSGKIIVEDMNFTRIIIGRVSVEQIHELFTRHGNRLLQKNIRRYLGLGKNRVNHAIRSTLLEKADNFYFYNNGITIICDKFDYNALQQENHIVNIKNLQIINGGQTCKTIFETYPNMQENAYVMLKIYQLSEENSDFVNDVTYATNSQNPVDLQDLRSTDSMQCNLKLGIKDLGYTYKRQRDDIPPTQNTITSSVVAESVLAIWRHKPHQAKFRRKEHFGKLYNDIFKDLSAAQAILAVIIFREVENKRKRPPMEDVPSFLPYASHYLAMLIGKLLLKDFGITLHDISHRNFNELRQKFITNQDAYHARAVKMTRDAISAHYGGRDISLQQQSAIFRRGDLLGYN